MTDHSLSPNLAGSEPAAGAAGANVADAADAPTAPAADDAVELRLSRGEAEALLLAVDALTPLLERIRQEVAPEPEPAPEPQSGAPAGVETPDFDDALHRATRLARQSLREARVAIGRGQQSAEQRRAWQEAARRYVAARAARRAGSSGR
jgi:hypothetical protein